MSSYFGKWYSQQKSSKSCPVNTCNKFNSLRSFFRKNLIFSVYLPLSSRPASLSQMNGIELRLNIEFQSSAVNVAVKLW